MILHSVVPCDMVFPPKPQDIDFYKLKYGFVEYSKKTGEICKINSTNPYDYLNLYNIKS